MLRTGKLRAKTMGSGEKLDFIYLVKNIGLIERVKSIELIEPEKKGLMRVRETGRLGDFIDRK